MNEKQNRKLRNFLINKDVQIRVIALNVIYTLLIVLITGGIVLVPLMGDMYLSEDPQVQYLAAQAFLTLTSRLAPTIAFVVLLIVIHIIITTHRVCGPMVNFGHTFDRIAKGDLTRKVFLRKADYLKPEAEKINAMIDSLSTTIFEIRTHHENLMASLENAVQQTSGSNPNVDLQKSLTQMQHEAQKAEKKLDKFVLLNI